MQNSLFLRALNPAKRSVSVGALRCITSQSKLDAAAKAKFTAQDEESFFARHNIKLKVAAALALGYYMGKEESALKKLEFPSSTRACCEGPELTDAQVALPEKLKSLVGADQVLGSNSRGTAVYTKGARLGNGKALAIVKPGTLKEAVEVLKECVKADVALLPQGANTGLTGGSVPRDVYCDRPTVIINVRRLNKIYPIGNGEQVLCFSGAGIFTLAQELEKISRDSHSSLGSIFLDPCVGAGIAFGSGGTQIRKGPAYTEKLLYCKVAQNGEVQLVNTLGVLAQNDEDLLRKLEAGKLTSKDMDLACTAAGSDASYRDNVCRLDQNVSRYNADLKGPEPNRSEGKVFILASIHDTFPLPKKSELYWVSCKDFEMAQELKSKVVLNNPNDLPQSCEYMDRDTFDCVDSSGRILVKMIELVGMKWLGPLWGIKILVENLPVPFAGVVCDKFLYWCNNILPSPLSRPLMTLGKQYDHHVLIEMAEFGGGELERLKERFAAYVASKPEGSIKYHVCNPAETSQAKYFRFSVAAAFKTMVIGENIQGVSIDYSLPKNEFTIPPLASDSIAPLKRLRYSHFGCNVVHEDLAYAPNVVTHFQKMKMKKTIEGMSGKLPAEHGHGTEYHAPLETQKRWMDMDPKNVMNPGIGGLPYSKEYKPE